MNAHRFYKGKALDSELRSLFAERSGKIPDLTKLEHEYHRRTFRVLIGVILFLGVLTAVSWAGFLLFGARGSQGDAALEILAPRAVVSGVPQEITLRYKNKDRNPIGLARISLRPIPGLEIKETIPAPSAEGRLEWNLGTLASRASGEIKLKAIPYGLPDTNLSLQAILTYKPANFNAEFQAVASTQLQVAASGISATLDGPPAAKSGEELAFVLRYENRTDETFRDLRLRLSPSSAFTLTSADPKPAEEVWKIAELAPGAKGEINLKGTFTSREAATQELKVILETKRSGQTYTLSEGKWSGEIEGSTLALELLVNGAPALPWVRLGSALELKLKVSNLGEAPAQGISSALSLTSALLDWSVANAPEGTVGANAITFPKDGLITLAPGKTQEFTAVVPVVSSASSNLPPLIKAQAALKVGDLILSSAPVEILVVSDTRLEAQARYFSAGGGSALGGEAENQPVGAGPLPPKVGEETKFELRWKIINSFHDLSGATVIARLPEGVRFVGPTSVAMVGTLRYIPETQEVRWEIGRLPIAIKQTGAAFQVAVTPTAAQRNELLPLLGVSRAEVTDAITQVSFTVDAPSLSSSLDADPSAKNKGVVQ